MWQFAALEPSSVESKNPVQARDSQIPIARLRWRLGAAHGRTLWLGPRDIWCGSLMVSSGLSAAAQPHQSSSAIASQRHSCRVTKRLSFKAVVRTRFSMRKGADRHQEILRSSDEEGALRETE